MKAEKVILSFIAILIGLVAAGVAFYFYQLTKSIPSQKAQPMTVNSKISPTQAPNPDNFLSVDTPQDEQVFDKKVISVAGKTASDATVIVSTETEDEVVKPAANGNFSLTSSIPDGTSVISITAIFASGEEKKVTKTVTFSTESF